MPVRNAEIVRILNKIAYLLELKGANPFRVRAYRNAAWTIGSLSKSVGVMVSDGEDLSQLPGIGKDLSARIEEIVEAGKSSFLEQLEKEVPPDLSDLLKVVGLGPKRVRVLNEKLGVISLDELKKAAEEGRIREIRGFGEKTERKILDEAARVGTRVRRTKLTVADKVAKEMEKFLREVDGVQEATAAGSYRRRLETVGDLDVVAACEKGSPVMENFVDRGDVDTVFSKGETRSTVLLSSGLQVDLRVVPAESYGAALQYFTGSKSHNVAIRRLGQKMGYRINEYGVFSGDKRIAGRSEEEVYATIGLPYIEPELREDRGEIEAAGKGMLPALVAMTDIRGDLHVHSRYTDGRNSMEEMALAAAERGYDYLAITDHSKRLAMVHGLDAKRLAEQIDEIDRLNGKMEKIAILKGVEVDILEDGSLDLPDDILKKLDVVVCSIHHQFQHPRDKQTERIIRAMDNRYFTILGHPTGRLINKRDPYDVDMEKVIEAARDRGCFLEVNAYPDRLDLTDLHCRTAREMGVMVAISTDAHRTAELDYMRFGLGQARRGWLEKGDVLNTRSFPELKKLLSRRR